jgi:hypothetical protein
VSKRTSEMQRLLAPTPIKESFVVWAVNHDIMQHCNWRLFLRRGVYLESQNERWIYFALKIGRKLIRFHSLDNNM